jgi:beta-lactamase superfamily II metal-dependent hydrolase
MMKLHVIQARFGDCLLLEYGEGSNHAFMLIDGGPSHNYDEQLKPALLQLLNGHNSLHDIVVSHVDNDHIVGVLDLLTALQKEQDKGGTPFLSVGQLWFNTFGNTIGTQDIEKRMGDINKVAAVNGVQMQAASVALNGIKEGSRVLLRTKNLNIPVNADAPGGFYLAAKNNPVINRSNLAITVIGPTAANLKKLQEEWEAWVKKNEQQIAAGKYTREVAANLDRSVPNLSSIVILVKGEGRSILLTGDCRSDHLQQGLIETGLSADGRFHVNILKVPHHGSMRNASKTFYEQVTADTYIISADGTNGNPDTDTLSWILKPALAAGRKIKLVFTNETPSTTAFLQQYPPVNWEAQFLPKDAAYLTL